MSWVLVTSNENKWLEAQRILGKPLERLSIELPEIQAATTAEVAAEKARAAFAQLKRPLIVEDAGIELDAFGSFPGPFIKYWEQLGGLESICRAVDGSGKRGVQAVCVLAIATDSGVQVVEGRVRGTVSRQPRGTNGFGWDAIFVPENETRTFAELSPTEKDERSHRRRAWEALRSKLG